MMFRSGSRVVAALRRRELVMSKSLYTSSPQPLHIGAHNVRLLSSTPEEMSGSDTASSTTSSGLAQEVYRVEQSSLYFRSAEAMLDKTAKDDDHHDGNEPLDYHVATSDDDHDNGQSSDTTESINAGDEDEYNTATHSEDVKGNDIPNIVDAESAKLSRAMCGRIEYALGRGDAPEVMRLFIKAEEEADQYYLRTGLLREMVVFLCSKAESGAFNSIYRVFNKYCRDCKERDFEILPHIWRSVCYALGVCRIKPSKPGFIKKVVDFLMENIEEMDEEDQHKMLPILLVSLANQENRFAQEQARSILQKIREQGIDMDIGKLTKILEIPVGISGTNLPRHLVLQLMVERGKFIASITHSL